MYMVKSGDQLPVSRNSGITQLSHHCSSRPELDPLDSCGSNSVSST